MTPHLMENKRRDMLKQTRNEKIVTQNPARPNIKLNDEVENNQIRISHFWINLELSINRRLNPVTLKTP